MPHVLLCLSADDGFDIHLKGRVEMKGCLPTIIPPKLEEIKIKNGHIMKVKYEGERCKAAFQEL